MDCQVSLDTLHCNGDGRSYSKPRVAESRGYNSGPFVIRGEDNDIRRAVVPRHCAAFVRSTLLLPGGNIQPSLSATTYCIGGPTMLPSELVHQYEISGIGYAFTYDDDNPDGEHGSSAVSSGNPDLLIVSLGRIEEHKQS